MTFLPAIYTFPPWRGTRSLYPAVGEAYPLPEAAVQFSIGFSDHKTLDGECVNGWLFDRNSCINKLQDAMSEKCNSTNLFTTSSPSSIRKTEKDGCVSFHVGIPPSTLIGGKGVNSKGMRIHTIFSDSTQFRMDRETIICEPVNKNLEEGEKGWCECWFEGLAGQKRRFWPTGGDMKCWNLAPGIWRPEGGRGEG